MNILKKIVAKREKFVIWLDVSNVYLAESSLNILKVNKAFFL